VVGDGLNHILPGREIALGAFALVAMAATFGAATRATFTSIVFVFELTRDYKVILPLMVATVVADLVYSAVNEDSLMTEKLRRRGLRVGRHYGVDPFTTATVAQVMTGAVTTLDATSAIGDARALFLKGGHAAYPIVDGHDSLASSVVATCSGTAGWTLSPAGASRDVVTVRLPDSAQTVLRVMLDENVEHYPVIDDGALVGICTRTDLLKVRQGQFDLERP
jgi:CBS domain-containing protein